MGEKLIRADGWESRLAAAVAGALDRPYRLGEHDCFIFANRCAEAMTGVNPGIAFIGKYTMRIGVLRLIRAYAGGGLREGITKMLGIEPLPPRQARRGDWLLYHDDVGEHIGVCLGGTAAVLIEHGLSHVALDKCVCAWAIG